MKAKQRKVYEFSSTILATFFGRGDKAYRVVEHAMPADATVVGCEMSIDGRVLRLMVESAEFEPVGPREVYPAVSPLVTSLRPPTWPA